MADELFPVEGFRVQKRLQDMGDGTYAEVVVNSERAAPIHRREITGLAGVRQTLDYSALPIDKVIFDAIQEGNGTAQLTASIAVCFDAPSDLVADTWLTAASSGLVDSQRKVFRIDADVKDRTFDFLTKCTRIDIVRAYGSETLDVVATGREAA